MCLIHVSFARRNIAWLASIVLATAVASCNPAAVLTNNVTSLGGATVGSRGNVDVTFVNNTPYFAIFTFGAYDPLNEPRQPEFRQFFADSDTSLLRLERNSNSATFTFQCARILSLGDSGLLEAVRTRVPDIDTTTLSEGITFSDRLSSETGARTVTINDFVNQYLALGVEYRCESLVIFTFELDDTQPQGIRVDVDVIPAE